MWTFQSFFETTAIENKHEKHVVTSDMEVLNVVLYQGPHLFLYKLLT